MTLRDLLLKMSANEKIVIESPFKGGYKGYKAEVDEIMNEPEFDYLLDKSVASVRVSYHYYNAIVIEIE